MISNPVGWFEIYVDNMERAKKFYESVFSVKLERLNSPEIKMYSPEIEMWSFPVAMNEFGASGALVNMTGFSPARNSIIIYFSCEDCAQEEEKIKASGGKIKKSKFSIGQYGYITLGYDTEGNMIGLHSMQ
ncbi:MAG: VOC family protein [Candidatus Nitrotoga sp.]